MAKVIQADRDAAADHSTAIQYIKDVIRAGKMDGSPTVQGYASHREASTAKLEADMAVLVEALKPFVAVVTEDVGDDEADCDQFRPMTRYNRAPALTVGDFRNAREALTRIQGEYRSGEVAGE